MCSIILKPTFYCPKCWVWNGVFWYPYAMICTSLNSHLITLFLHYYLNKFILCWSLSYSISLIIRAFFSFKNMSWLCAYLLIHHGHLANFFWLFLLGGEEEGDANPGYFTVLCRHSLHHFFFCTHCGSCLDKDKQLSIILALFLRNERKGLIPQPQRRKYVMQSEAETKWAKQIKTNIS